MKTKKNISHIILFVLMTCGGLLQAEQVVIQDNHELHYNTFPSTFLSKEIANTYQITRSKNRGILSISVLDKSDKEPKAVEADITIEAKNLVHQSKEIKLIKIKEQNDAIYYLGTFALNNEENVNFSIEAKPKGSDTVFMVKFTREFFTD